MSDVGEKALSNKNIEQSIPGVSLKPTPEIMDLWTNIHGKMRGEFGEAIFRSALWASPI